MTHVGASNRPQTSGLTDTSHIQFKYGTDMGWLRHDRARPPRLTRPMLAHPTPLIFVPILSSEQTLATSLHSPPLPSTTRAHLRLFATFSAKAGSGSDSDQSGSVDWGVIPCGLEEVMAVRIALAAPGRTVLGRRTDPSAATP